jgi:hypothetical protein
MRLAHVEIDARDLFSEFNNLFSQLTAQHRIHQVILRVHHDKFDIGFFLTLVANKSGLDQLRPVQRHRRHF